ncbi:PucR family transcriptional regulator [Solwaraspora sp. WMMA2056]|uniref:PucR family transcriptional regulator n=1 Tax=Solwaraspora sp. WMMA2056 TaxID=3015161 RepID=UPI00259BA5EA|nr:PucR family transcriptional regulator [Solwaraspora sp. WMMA2056]WJK38395.1 PucR family transcriptional regulator [Solwaraspora sp. WMMA2056]
MFPTVGEVLALEPVRHGGPRVVAAEERLNRLVRWVHVTEVPDIASLLRGGELVLTTGIGLPADDAGLRAFVAELAEVGVAGLVVELGRRYHGGVPKVMVAAAARHGLPLVELRRATPFVLITEAVHALIVDAQLAQLRATEEIHQRFTELSVEGAEAAEVVRQAAELAGAPVVLENLARRVLAYHSAGENARLLLDGWEQHSRRIQPAGRTAYHADTGWLVTMVGARGQDWGRLLLRCPGTGPDAAGGPDGASWPAGAGGPPTRLSILLERAASTLALGRLIRRDADGLERQIHRTLLTALLDGSQPADEVAVRARALGVDLDRRHLVGLVVRFRDPDPAAGSVAGAGSGSGLVARPASVAAAEAVQARLRDLAESVGLAVREAGLAGLTSPLDDHAVGVLLAVRTAALADTALDDFLGALRRLRRSEPAPVVVAAGSGVDGIREARRTLVEARQVAEAGRRDRRADQVLRLPDVGLAGLLHLLREEPRLQVFVERELGALLAYEARHPREQLLATLRAYLEHGRNKSAAAAAVHLSRPAFYERLTRLGRILDADLESVQVCLSLHVALLAWEAVQARPLV